MTSAPLISTDFPQDVMDAAAALRSVVNWQSNAANAAIATFLLAEREAERERCARVADAYANRDTGREIAAAIRKGT